MALSNLRKEPQRELTESAVGILTVSGFLFLDFKVSRWIIDTFQVQDFGRSTLIPIGEGMVMFTLGAIVACLLGIGIFFLFAELTHILGENICNKLQNRGIHLRPKTRRV